MKNQVNYEVKNIQSFIEYLDLNYSNYANYLDISYALYITLGDAVYTKLSTFLNIKFIPYFSDFHDIMNFF